MWPVDRLEGSFLAIELRLNKAGMSRRDVQRDIAVLKRQGTAPSPPIWRLGRPRYISESVAPIFAVASPPIAARLNQVSNATSDACLWPW